VDETQTMTSITAAVADRVADPRRTTSWRIAASVAALGVLILLTAITWLFWQGVGVWGVNSPTGWGIAIASFVWWVGIGHAGTLISAILLLCQQRWRNSINRFAEAMTLFAIVCAAMYPLLHLGRPEFFYWLLPYPSTYGYWPQFRSPLVWDIFAIGTYGIVSLVFWYLGLVPDLATMRDRASGWHARVWAFFALGWRGSSTQWVRHRRAYRLLAGLATALVVSVHTVVSFDFAVSQLPGWHSTVFPPYFVAGALYSGLAMVLTLVIPLRAWFDLGDFVTKRHVEMCAKLALASGLVTSYGYFAELFFGWYGGEPSDLTQIHEHLVGFSAPLYWTVIGLNVGLLQLLWFRRVRGCAPVLFVISIGINVGMWLERYLIVITSLERDFLPSSWGHYTPTYVDWATLGGSFGLFLFLLLVFIRFVPMISMSEMRELAIEPELEGREGGHDGP
jgi:Ni/Fe-hydrogenase subunit HybB-like protein